MKDKTKLAVIDGETLMDMRLVPTKFGNADSILMQSAFIASFAFVPRQAGKGIGLCPYPYAEGVTSFACK